MLNHPPRLLWANAGCLLDTSSGAAMAVREMLRQLEHSGFEILILGATIFDSPSGMTRISSYWDSLQQAKTPAVTVDDAPLKHHLVKTHNIARNQMTAQEEGTWVRLYRQLLDTHNPDIVFFYGGQVMDMLIPSEAHSRGIPSAAYLANGSYKNTHWCRDVSLFITNSQATARMYKQRLGVSSVCTGGFIDPAPVVADQHSRKRILMVNPSLEKGISILIRVAMLLETRRPDIQIEVVESRGNWTQLLQQITSAWGTPRARLSNVIVTANTTDMRPVYGRARMLMAPSLWWEAFGRVAAEAMLNGIPAIVTDRGGLPEVIGDAGMVINLPESYYAPPYLDAPSADQLRPIVDRIERWYDDEVFYQQYVQRAQEQAKAHSLEQNTQQLLAGFEPLVQQRRQPSYNANIYSSRKKIQSVLLNSFIGGPQSMGRVGQFMLRHLVTQGYDTKLLPFRNDANTASWSPETKERVISHTTDQRFDQQIKFCSVREARQKRYAEYLTPWMFHDVDGLPQHLVTEINTNDAVYASSSFVRDIFIAHGVKIPVKVLHMGFDTDYYHYVERSVDSTFTFLCIAEHTPRKNLPMLLSAFNKAFANTPHVRLIIKTGIHNANELLTLAKSACNIEIVQKLLSREQELVELYQRAHCFVLPTHFEGFGMPMLEAMATGLPVITTHYSGHLDFCHPENSFLVDVKRMIPADRQCFPNIDGWWAQPDEEHLIAQMQYVFQHYDQALAIGRKGYESVAQNWTWNERLKQEFPG